MQAVSGPVRMTPISPSAATSEPAGWVSRNLHSTVPSGHRTPARLAGTDCLEPAVNVWRDDEAVDIGVDGTGDC